MTKKKSKIKVRKARILKVEPLPDKPDVVLVHADDVQLEVEAPYVPAEPFSEPVMFDSDEKKLSGWSQWWKDLWG